MLSRPWWRGWPSSIISTIFRFEGAASRTNSGSLSVANAELVAEIASAIRSSPIRFTEQPETPSPAATMITKLP